MAMPNKNISPVARDSLLEVGGGLPGLMLIAAFFYLDPLYNRIIWPHRIPIIVFKNGRTPVFLR